MKLSFGDKLTHGAVEPGGHLCPAPACKLSGSPGLNLRMRKGDKEAEAAEQI